MSAGGATQVDGLFSAEVPVAGRQTEQRNQAITEAYGVVLGKISGYPAIAERPELSEALAQAARYVQQFRYRSDPAPAPDETAEPRLLLRVQFDANGLMRVLRENRLPVWGSMRPTVLAWLGVERNGRRMLATAEAEPDAWGALRDAAEARGLPLVMPLFDLEDHAALETADLWGGFEERLRSASARYAPDVILVAVADRRRSGWKLRWTLLQADRRTEWNSAGSDLGSALAAGVGRSADELAARYAPMGAVGSVRSLQLRIAGIGDLVAFARVRAQLEGLDMVERAQLLELEPTAALFELQLTASPELLEQALVLGGLLEPVAAAFGDRLEYRLHP